MRHYVINEFQSSAIAQDKSQVRTQWTEVKGLVIAGGVVFAGLIITYLLHY